MMQDIAGRQQATTNWGEIDPVSFGSYVNGWDLGWNRVVSYSRMVHIPGLKCTNQQTSPMSTGMTLYTSILVAVG
jgi:hypothetical protein